MIEDAKSILRIWGAAEPNFLLCNSKLTFQMTMTPEKTQYLTQGPDGVRRLKAGPNITTYRGLNIIHSRAFSIEDGAPPRDVLRRRVRVAEYYRIPWEEGIEERHFSFYDESKDAWQKLSWSQLFSMANIGQANDDDDEEPQDDNDDPFGGGVKSIITKFPGFNNGNGFADFEITREGLDVIKSASNPNAYRELGPLIADVRFKHPLHAACTDGEIAAALTEVYKDVQPNYSDLTDERQKQFVRQAANERLPRYFMDFATGNRNKIPYAVSMFLAYFNWQGLQNEEGDLLGNVRSHVVTSLFQTIFPNFQQMAERDAGFPDYMKPLKKARWELVVIRPNIEHNMLGIVMGRGGLEELGATFWGQTELSCYDDSMHGIWGMSYKYNTKAIVINNKNLIRLWDVAYDGYNGGDHVSLHARAHAYASD